MVVYKWWQGERDPQGRLLSGKPNVWARKVVNTQVPPNSMITPLPASDEKITKLQQADQ